MHAGKSANMLICVLAKLKDFKSEQLMFIY